jgi:hypothetical protein
MDFIQRVIWELGQNFAFSVEDGNWGFRREPEPRTLLEGRTVKSVFGCKGQNGIEEWIKLRN